METAFKIGLIERIIFRIAQDSEPLKNCHKLIQFLLDVYWDQDHWTNFMKSGILSAISSILSNVPTVRIPDHEPDNDEDDVF